MGAVNIEHGAGGTAARLYDSTTAGDVAKWLVSVIGPEHRSSVEQVLALPAGRGEWSSTLVHSCGRQASASDAPLADLRLTAQLGFTSTMSPHTISGCGCGDEVLDRDAKGNMHLLVLLLRSVVDQRTIEAVMGGQWGPTREHWALTAVNKAAWSIRRRDRSSRAVAARGVDAGETSQRGEWYPAEVVSRARVMPPVSGEQLAWLERARPGDRLHRLASSLSLDRLGLGGRFRGDVWEDPPAWCGDVVRQAGELPRGPGRRQAAAELADRLDTQLGWVVVDADERAFDYQEHAVEVPLLCGAHAVWSVVAAPAAVVAQGHMVGTATALTEPMPRQSAERVAEIATVMFRDAPLGVGEAVTAASSMI